MQGVKTPGTWRDGDVQQSSQTTLGQEMGDWRLNPKSTSLSAAGSTAFLITSRLCFSRTVLCARDKSLGVFDFRTRWRWASRWAVRYLDPFCLPSLSHSPEFMARAGAVISMDKDRGTKAEKKTGQRKETKGRRTRDGKWCSHWFQDRFGWSRYG